MDRSQTPVSVGAYGFALAGLDRERERLVPAEPDWPQLRVIRAGRDPARTPEPPGTIRVTDTHAEAWVLAGDRVAVDRETMTARLETSEPLSDEAVLHPYLALATALASHWFGRRVLHGGAFSHRGGAWGLVGDKAAGKSSTLAALLRAGYPIVSDDLLVLDGGRVLSGPRSIDLRQGAAEVLGGDELGLIGDRRRWRLRPGVVPASHPLAGFVYLEWGEALHAEPLPPAQRLTRIIDGCFVVPRAGDELPLLELCGLPAWRLVRPRRIDALEPALAQLLSIVG